MRPKHSGFTLLEMLIVVGIIMVLLGFLSSGIGYVRETTQRVSCAANTRSLAVAWLNYLKDHDETMAVAHTVGGWVDQGDSRTAVTSGSLYSYCPDADSYRCPADHNQYNRSYSFFCQLNGEANYTKPPWNMTMLTRYSQLSHPENTLLLIEEFDPRGYNIGSFVLPDHGDSWIDFPANWHNSGVNVAYADGHAEYFKYSDKRTAAIQSFYANTPNNPDLKFLQAHVPPN